MVGQGPNDRQGNIQKSGGAGQQGVAVPFAQRGMPSGLSKIGPQGHGDQKNYFLFMSHIAFFA